jgi:diguanylate cyclase
MTGDPRYEAACERAGEVLGAMARHRLTPSPENYRIWYVHFSGDDPALSRTLRALLDGGEPIDDARCAELHERFFRKRRLKPTCGSGHKPYVYGSGYDCA